MGPFVFSFLLHFSRWLVLIYCKIQIYIVRISMFIWHVSMFWQICLVFDFLFEYYTHYYHVLPNIMTYGLCITLWNLCGRRASHARMGELSRFHMTSIKRCVQHKVGDNILNWVLPAVETWHHPTSKAVGSENCNKQWYSRLSVV